MSCPYLIAANDPYRLRRLLRTHRSAIAVARELDCSVQTVLRAAARFSIRYESIPKQRSLSDEIRAAIVDVYCEGYSMRETTRVIGARFGITLTHATVRRWVRAAGRDRSRSEQYAMCANSALRRAGQERLARIRHAVDLRCDRSTDQQRFSDLRIGRLLDMSEAGAHALLETGYAQAYAIAHHGERGQQLFPQWPVESLPAVMREEGVDEATIAEVMAEIPIGKCETYEPDRPSATKHERFNQLSRYR